MQINSKNKACHVLKISQDDLNACQNLDDKIKLYKKKHKKLALPWHPDKNPGRVEQAKKRVYAHTRSV